MRTKVMLALLAGSLSAGAAAAQSYPADAIISQPEVEVRSGPSTSFYATSKLVRNDRVRVIGVAKDPAWLEIQPPQHSYSWINAKYLEKNPSDPRYWRVKDAVSIRPGSTLPGAPAPNIENMKLSPGTIVVIVAKAEEVQGETWLPIQPQTTEVRYIPANAVPTPNAVATMNSPASWTRAPQDLYRDPNLAAAEQAFAAGDRNRAIPLYQQVVNNGTDPNSKVIAQNRLASLQGPYTPIQGTTTSLSPANPASTTPLNLQTLKAPAWTTYGRLRDIKLQREDGQPIYSLEDAQGKVITYVSTNPGKSLNIYIGRWVSVFGPTMYRPDTAARMPYVVASHVAVP